MNNEKDRELQSKLAEASKGVGQVSRHLAEYPDEANLAAMRNGLLDRRRNVLRKIGQNDARSANPN